MTIILRVTEPPTAADLGAAGVCRVGLAEIVGCWGCGRIVRVVFLGIYGAAA